MHLMVSRGDVSELSASGDRLQPALRATEFQSARQQLTPR
jgi:hypothetical protein